MVSQGPKSEHEPDPQLNTLRKILFGKNNRHILDAVRNEAREIVSDVFCEALKDRQQKDHSVGNVIAPLVDESVEYSVSNRKEQFVGYMYPIVGSVVRKSVTAFLTEFIERTNQLLENSLTIKGLTWRLRARQAGIPYANYVASQTFNYRVEQVFLIHNETGLLLNTVAQSQHASADADLISSMLIAINDFVTDSFKHNTKGNEQGLNMVKTDDFTLVLKAGPNAVLVAAVTGNMPQKIANQMQLSIEQIHSLYKEQLNSFDGDTSEFEDCDKVLAECLICELKDPEKQKRSKPWMAWGVLLMLGLGLSLYAHKLWLVRGYAQQLTLINQEPGVMLVRLQRQGIKKITLDVLRDPQSRAIHTWLADNAIPQTLIEVTEKPYLSLEDKIIEARIRQVISRFPSISSQGQLLIGNVNPAQYRELSSALNETLGITNPEQLLSGIKINDAPPLNITDKNSIETLLALNINRINSTSIEFASNSAALSPQANKMLKELAYYAEELIRLSTQAQRDVSFIIMGISDHTGSQAYNELLSIKRANAVKEALHQFGLPNNKLNATGIGIIHISDKSSGARKELFSAITTELSQSQRANKSL